MNKGVKRCTDCKRTLPACEFSVDRTRRECLRGLCKRCNRAVSKQERERKKSKDAIPAYQVLAKYPKWLAP